MYMSCPFKSAKDLTNPKYISHVWKNIIALDNIDIIHY